MDADISQPRIQSFLHFSRSRRFWAGLAAALLLGALLASLDGTGRWLPGWAAYSVISAFAIGLIVAAGRLTGAGQAGNAAWVAFILRLSIGVFLFMIFPSAGYPDNQATQSGYTFQDAFVRDQQAWRLAESETQLVSAFSGTYEGDQYGGMLAMSAGVYRYLSPDVHRPFLILILGAAAAAWGVFLVWKAAENWFGPAVGRMAGWIFALYPESLLLGSSHMREPFIITAVAMAFFSLSSAGNNRRVSIGWLLAAILILLLFQPSMALFASLLLFGLLFFDPKHKVSWKQILVFILILFVSIGIVISVWAGLPSLSETRSSNILFTWFYNNFVYHANVTESSSGWLQRIFSQIGDQWQMPFVLIYGVTRPVLPAALGDKDSVLLVWRVINILRSVGWYALALPLVYGLFSAWRAQNLKRRGQIVWLFLLVWIWILIASAAAGGDQWDNPRYRSAFLAFQVVIASWAINRAFVYKDAWLLRWLYVEVIAVAAMTIWYISRNYIPWFTLDIWPVLGVILGLSGWILIRGWRLDRKTRREIQPLGYG
jgi:hypothetical protein